MPGVDRRQRPDLVPDPLGVGLAPVVAQPAGELEDDRQVVAGARRAGRPPCGRAGRAARELVTVPSRLGPGGARRQDDVGELGGPGQEQVLDDQEVEALEQPWRARWSASDWTGFSPMT